MIATYLFIVLLVCMLMGMPVAVSLGFASATTILFFSTDSFASIAQQFYSAVSEHETLLAIPFFILSSAFLTTGGIAERIIRFANNCIGHVRGGLAMASVLACMIFASVSGSSPATVAAIGSIVIAGMVKAGYPERLAVGVITTTGTLGILIPPSIVMIVYATATEQSTSALFAAGVIPGLLMGIIIMITIYVIALIKKFPSDQFPGVKPLVGSFFKALGGLMLIIIVLGAIYGGIASPTEAAALSAVYAFLVSVLVYRDIGPLKNVALRKKDESIPVAIIRGIKDTVLCLVQSIFNKEVHNTILEGVKTSLMLLFIIANAMLFAFVLTSQQIPQGMAETIAQANVSPWMFLIIVNIILLVAGSFMEPSAIMLIMAPIFLPIAMKLGINPIHLGIIMVVNMEIGLLSPPVGLNLFVASSVTGRDLAWVIRSVAPWFILMIAFLLLITYVPQISMWFPDWLQARRLGG